MIYQPAPLLKGWANRLGISLAAMSTATLWLGLSAHNCFAQAPPAPPLPIPAQFETGSVTVSQANADAWQWVPFTRTFAAPPIVIMGPAAKADGSPLVVTAVDVYTNGFYCQLNEWEYLDGAHANETVHFLALAEGTHVFGTQRWQVGKIAAANRTTSSVTLTGFTATPVVLAQINSHNNWTTNDGLLALNTRLSNVTSTGFQLKLETQQSDTGALFDESVSYIAVSQGTGYLDGAILSAVRTTATVTDAFSTLTFPAARTSPTFIAQAQTMNDPDPGELRMQSLTTTNVQVQFQEETSSSTDVIHAAEEVGYIVLGTMSGETLAKVEIGDITVTQSSTTTWTTVTLANTYTTPVVVMGPLSYTNGTPLTIRVRSVTSNSFQFQVDRWDHGNQTHPYLEKLSYIAMESGSYAIGGVRWQAGRNTAVTQSGVTQSLTTGFPNTPVVFSQVATTNDPAAVQSRVSGISATGFTIELDESEIDTTAHAAETVHWIALTPGTSNFFSTQMRLQAGTVTNQDSSFRTQLFSRNHADPFLFAAMQSKIDTDPATLRWRNLFADRVDLVAQEDNHPLQFGEGTVNNTHSAETVAFLVAQGAVDTDGDGAPDAWETSKGLNPNLASDGALDPDGDVLTNQQEFHNRLDFVTSSDPFTFTGGVVTVAVGTTNAYEINDKSIVPNTSTAARYSIGRLGGLAPLTVNFTTAGTAATDTNRAPASSADYTLWTAATGGTQLTTSISVPVNSTGVSVYVRPTVDTIDEYVEGLRMTLAANGSTYTIGSANNAVVLINDAQDLPANERLFVAPFLPQPGVATGASGFATIILAGPNNKARISTSFNGLTTPQNDIDGCHVHYANTGSGPIPNGTIIYGEPDGLPTGPLVDYPWAIVDSAGLKGQQIIDSLFRKNTGENLYINVHTNRYASGEIRADLTLQTGSQTPPPTPASPTLETLASDQDAKRDCARFLTQATYGPSEADIDALYNSIAGDKKVPANRIAAFTTWLNNQWAAPQSTLYDYNYAADQQEWSLWGQQPALPDGLPPPDNAVDWQRWGTGTYRTVPSGLNKESYDPDYNNRRRAWWLLANRAQDQLRQRAAEALEQIFVVSDRDGSIQTRAYSQSRYYDVLGDAADGVRSIQPPIGQYTTANGTTLRVRELLEDITKNAVMGRYLSHLRNQKATVDGSGNVLTQPDENYAREIMQLFTIGLLNLWEDGTLQLANNGQPIATYSNDDIKELARVFTGWSLAWKVNTAALGYTPPLAETNFFGSDGLEYFHPGWENPMKIFIAYHDEAAKAPPSLGFTRPDYTGLSTDTTARETYAEADLDATLDALCNHANIAPFLSRLLIQRFVTSNPSRGYIYRVTQKFKDDGTASHVRGNLKAVINAILLDYEARSLTNMDPQTINNNTSVNVGYGKVKEPMIRYIQVLRAFGAKSQLNVSDLSAFGYPNAQLNNLGSSPTRYRYVSTVADLAQTPNDMPSVFNWYLPDYTPGGRASAAGLVAPELQIITENIAIRSINYHRQIDYSSVIDPAAALPTGQGGTNLLGDSTNALDNVFINLAQVTADYKAVREAVGATEVSSATYLVDRLDAVLCAGALKAKYAYTQGATDPRSIMIDQLATIAVDAPPVSLANAGARVRAALYLITSSPEFIVQK